QFLDKIVGKKPRWDKLEEQARSGPPRCDGIMALPFVLAEPSLGVMEKRFAWLPAAPKEPGHKFRAALEAHALLVALGANARKEAQQKISRIGLPGGKPTSGLACEIAATALGMPLERLQSDEAPALGAAVTALAALESSCRRQQGIEI